MGRCAEGLSINPFGDELHLKYPTNKHRISRGMGADSITRSFDIE